jgi:asparagine synthase (glutamine-hydrolysing)
MLDERRRTDWRAMLLALAMSAGVQADIRASVAGRTGVEERDPTVDRRVLEVALRQPEWVRRHDGITRAVVRGAMADRLPPEILHRTRRGEQLPDWLDVITARRAELAVEVEELAGHPASRQLIDTDRLQRLVARLPDRTSRAEPAVVRDYRLALLRALVVSRYMRWFERRAVAPPLASADARA